MEISSITQHVKEWWVYDTVRHGFAVARGHSQPIRIVVTHNREQWIFRKNRWAKGIPPVLFLSDYYLYVRTFCKQTLTWFPVVAVATLSSAGQSGSEAYSNMCKWFMSTRHPDRSYSVILFRKEYSIDLDDWNVWINWFVNRIRKANLFNLVSPKSEIERGAGKSSTNPRVLKGKSWRNPNFWLLNSYGFLFWIHTFGCHPSNWGYIKVIFHLSR